MRETHGEIYWATVLGANPDAPDTWPNSMIDHLMSTEEHEGHPAAIKQWLRSMPPRHMMDSASRLDMRIDLIIRCSFPPPHKESTDE